jgi:hypothetical protein
MLACELVRKQVALLQLRISVTQELREPQRASKPSNLFLSCYAPDEES